MKMNNKGFTLIELLAVMVILISISLVAVGSVTESLIRNDKREYEKQQELAINAAKIYFSLNNKTCVTVKKLNGYGGYDYFKDDKMIDLLKKSDCVRLDGNEYRYVVANEYVADPEEESGCPTSSCS